MVRVVWSAEAVADLNRIAAYVAIERPIAATRLAAKLAIAAADLQTFPNRGRSIRGGRRELTRVAPYLIRYRLRGEAVEILSIRHGARRPE